MRGIPPQKLKKDLTPDAAAMSARSVGLLSLKISEEEVWR
jgi:hypothetical protein